VEFLECLDGTLSFWGDQALAVELTVGAGVSLVAWGKEVGGDVAFARDEGDDCDLFGDVREFGEELGGCVAFEDVLGDGVAGFEGLGEARGIGIVEEDLGFEDVGGLLGDVGVVAECEIEEDFDRGTAFHVGEQFEGEGGGDFCRDGFAEDDFLQETGLFSRCAGGAGEGVVDQEFEGIRAVLVGRVFDLGDDFRDECPVIDRFRGETFGFTFLDFGEVFLIQAHVKSVAESWIV
jgi:hypothetical protein